MKGPILATVALAAILAAEVPIAQAVVFVRTPPPRPRSVGVVGRSPGPGFVWTGGYWRWGRGRRGRRRVRVGAGQVETRAAYRCSLGFAKLARRSWRLHVRWRPLALTGELDLAPARGSRSCRRRVAWWRRMTALRIWDFRRGDDDDNRTSPHGGGLRRVLLSAALEFNYVKAAIGFLVLIIGPALLVGIVPSVAVTYGRLKFDAAASVG